MYIRDVIYLIFVTLKLESSQSINNITNVAKHKKEEKRGILHFRRFWDACIGNHQCKVHWCWCWLLRWCIIDSRRRACAISYRATVLCLYILVVYVCVFTCIHLCIYDVISMYISVFQYSF